MEQFISQLINGFSSGTIFALIALGYTMVYGIVKLINFAHGDVIMVGSFIIYFLIASTPGIHFIPAIFIAMACCAAVGVLMEKIAYKPLRNATRLSALITAIGVSFFLQNIFLVLSTSEPVTRFFQQTFELRINNPITFTGLSVQGSIPLFGSVTFGYSSLITISVSALMMILLQIFVKGTKMGKAMRAVSEDSGAASLMGINVNSTIAVTFAVGSALAAVGSALYISTYSQITPFMGMQMGLKAFVAAVLGGIGSIPGAMLGGILLGIIESMTKAYISTELSDAIVYTILIVVLLIKPSGLLGKSAGEKV